MSTVLTKKQKGFVKDYIKTGIGEIAVKNNYDVKDGNTARSIASENLTKPNIQKAIADAIPNDLLTERHLELLNKREVYHVGEGEYELIDQPDTQAVSKALDMAYKMKGAYAPEKNVNVNVDIESAEDIKAITEQLNAIYSRTSFQSNGGSTDTLDNQAQDSK